LNSAPSGSAGRGFPIETPYKPQYKHKEKREMTKKINIRPLGDRVLVEQKQEAEQIKGGIVIPDTAKEKPQEAVVIALGTGKVDDNGKKVPFDVKVGDVVLTSKYGGTDVKYDDKEYKILSSSDILAVID
jgi:chaperonin GroES